MQSIKKCWEKPIYIFLVEGHLSPDFSTPSLNPWPFNSDFSTMIFWTLRLKSSWLKSPGLKCSFQAFCLWISTRNFSTPDFSTMNFLTPWCKNSCLKSLGLKFILRCTSTIFFCLHPLPTAPCNFHNSYTNRKIFPTIL